MAEREARVPCWQSHEMILHQDNKRYASRRKAVFYK